MQGCAEAGGATAVAAPKCWCCGRPQVLLVVMVCSTSKCLYTLIRSSSPIKYSKCTSQPGCMNQHLPPAVVIGGSRLAVSDKTGGCTCCSWRVLLLLLWTRAACNINLAWARAWARCY
jgi:hypothetical protein